MTRVSQQEASRIPRGRGLVLPNESAIASAGAAAVWSERLGGQSWPAHVGREVFEDVARQAYLRFGPARGLPPVEEWGRWEGHDRNRQPVELDIVARLLDGRVMTGAVRFRTARADARVFIDHLHALERLAASGQPWAREALEPGAPWLFLSAAGFKDSFHEACAEQGDRPMVLWSIEDLFHVEP